MAVSQDSVRKLVMTNPSLIPAAFKTFIKSTRSVFRIDVRDGVLGPKESVDLHLTAHLDDTITHRDTLHIIVSEGDNIIVPLHAKVKLLCRYYHLLLRPRWTSRWHIRSLN